MVRNVHRASIASPTSVLKLNDSLHCSSHSSSSFSVREGVKALHPEAAVAALALPSPQQKSVSFSWNVTTVDIVHRHDMDEAEKDARWYRKHEWKRLRREGRVTARLVEDGELTEDNEDLGLCITGLKAETHGYARQRQLHKFLYKDALFSEQATQQKQGINDAETLSLKLMTLQSKCRHAVFVSSLRPNLPRREVP